MTDDLTALRERRREIDAQRQDRAKLPGKADWHGYEIDYANLLDRALNLVERREREVERQRQRIAELEGLVESLGSQLRRAVNAL